jgi:hypothetical protein
VANYVPDVANGWVQEIAGYVRQLDPYRHLVTVGSREFSPTLTANPLLDFTQGRYYQRLPLEGTGEHVRRVLDVIRQNRQTTRTPTLITGHSLNPWYEPTQLDPNGIHVQETLWAAALSGAAGGAMSDWGETYIVAERLESIYTPLTAFAAGVDWATLDLQPVEAGLLMQDASAYEPVRVNGFDRQRRTTPGDQVNRIITADGVIPTLSDVPSTIYGQLYNQALNRPQVYRVTVPLDTYLEVGVRRVSDQGGARLSVVLGDRMAAEMALPVGETQLSALRVPLPAGEQTITINNTGDDWLELDYIEIGQMVTPARVLTLRDSTNGVALAWLQHRDYAWDRTEVERAPLAFRYRLDNLPPGRYGVDLWSPLTGEALGEEVVRVGDDGVLLIDLPPFDTQLALRAFRRDGGDGEMATDN